MNAKSLRLARAAVCLVICAAAPAANATNLIKNGGFERPTLAQNTFKDYGPGALVRGWTVIGEPGWNVSVLNGQYSQAGLTLQAKAGAQWLDLTGNGSNRAEGVEQVVATTVGKTYRLKFALGNVVDHLTDLGTTSTVQVGIDDTTFFKTNDLGEGSTSLTWVTFAIDFVATSDQTTISFRNADPIGDNHNPLDQVSLVERSSAR